MTCCSHVFCASCIDEWINGTAALITTTTTTPPRRTRACVSVYTDPISFLLVASAVISWGQGLQCVAIHGTCKTNTSMQRGRSSRSCVAWVCHTLTAACTRHDWAHTGAGRQSAITNNTCPTCKAELPTTDVTPAVSQTHRMTKLLTPNS